MSMHAEQIDQATKIMGKSAGVRQIFAVACLVVKRVVLTSLDWLDKVFLTPNPKAAARHGLDLWASAEHVHPYEAARFRDSRGVPR